MDIYGTAVTVVQQVYQVTIFIKGIISDVKSYEQDRADVQLKLDLQLASLQFFQQRFLNPENGLMLPGHLPQWIAEAIRDLLLKMKRVLAEYEILVIKYGLLETTETTEASEEESLVGRERWKQSFLERTKAKLKALKLKGYDWSLFDKNKLLNVLQEYKDWSDSLRDLMQHFSQEAVYSIAGTVSSMQTVSLEGTGLEAVVKRQMLASTETPSTFHGLEGEIIEQGRSSNCFQPAVWKYNEDTMQVIVEYHEYDSRLKSDDLDSEEIAELKAPLRDLAWLLKNSTFSEATQDASESNQPTIYSLECLGFVDQPENERCALLYRLPSLRAAANSGNLITLHELITMIDNRTKRVLGKPSLGDRFNIAHCLALTVANLHGSRWVHKNIWSRGILLFQQTKNTGRSNASGAKNEQTFTNPRNEHMLAFLGDWGYARPVEAGTMLLSDFEVEPNFYRHPERQGKPTRQFTTKHDIYALGVVLLEIGLWKTVSQLFDQNIREAQKSGRLPKSKDVRAALVKLAQSEVPKDMGDTYAAAVVRCLTGSFRSGSETELSIDFREKVVDPIAIGKKL